MRNVSKPGPKPKLRNPEEFGRPFLTVDEFGQCVGFSRAEAYKYLNQNKLPIAKNGRRFLIPAVIAKAIQTGDYYLRLITPVAPVKEEGVEIDKVS